MGNGTTVRSRVYILIVPVLAGVCALGAAMALSRALTAREHIQLKARADSEAKHVAAQLRATVLKSVGVLPQIAGWWLTQGRPMAREDWETDAQLFLKSELSLREVLWLNKSGTPAWCLGPGRVPDFRCRAVNPELLTLLPEARTTDEVALSRVMPGEGAPRFYACKTVRRGNLRGYIAAAFDASELIQLLLEEQIPADYELQITADGQSVAALKHASGPIWREGLRSVEVKIANRSWTVSLTPAATDIQRMQRVVYGFGIAVAVLLSAWTALALIYKRKASALRVEVAERRRAEGKIAALNRDLQNQVTDFRTLIDVLPVGIAVSNDPECRDIWMNQHLAGMLHMSVGDNISRYAPNAESMPYKNFRNGVEVPPAELPMQLAARTGKCVLNMDLDVLREDGSILNTLSYSAPVFDDQGKLRHVINACVDITERRRAETERHRLRERLLRAEKYRSLALMAGGIAHDFNNLLTVIIGHTELARRDVVPQSAAGRAIAESLTAANRASELVAQLLAYTGRSWFESNLLDLSAEVEAIAEGLREMAPPNIAMGFELPPDLPPIQAGAREVQQVLRNLVANAVEAIGDSCGTIRVRTGCCTLEPADLVRDYPDQDLVPGTYVWLEVSDSGGGVPREVAARVFEPFFTTKFFGRGLGLSAVQGIMRAHRGGVRFDTSSGNGTRVQAIFPAESLELVGDRVA